VNISIARVLLK